MLFFKKNLLCGPQSYEAAAPYSLPCGSNVRDPPAGASKGSPVQYLAVKCSFLRYIFLRGKLMRELTAHARLQFAAVPAPSHLAGDVGEGAGPVAREEEAVQARVSVETYLFFLKKNHRTTYGMEEWEMKVNIIRCF